MAYDNNKPAFQYVPPPQDALSNNKLHIFCPSSQAGKQARLQWQFVDNNPRIKVFTNDEADKTKEKNFGSIYAKMDLMAFHGLMALIKKSIDLKEAEHFKIENKNFSFAYGKRSETPVVESETYVGKDKDGVIWISVIANNRPKLKFLFTGDQYHTFSHGNGTPFSLSERSVVHASAWVEAITAIIKQMTVDNYVDVEAKKAARDGNAGGKPGYDKKPYNKQQESSNASQLDNFDTDQDLPF